ncbi:MAG: argininosuccinate lyase [Caulobacterales bacterium]
MSGQNMWGGRFGAKPGEILQAINASIDVDRRLWAEDIEGSKAHAAMLAKQGIIAAEDAAAIQKGLDQIAGEIAEGKFAFRQELEDIHMHVEARLKEIVGDAGGRLHTARSRNDQVAVDFRLWVKRALQGTQEQLSGLIAALVETAGAHADWIMPGFTHLQTAQPITLGHHLLAYAEMAQRDRNRVTNAIANLDESPLGAAALAGTGFPIDREATAKALGFAAPMRNSLDAVSSRDFALEALAALSILSTHLSRLAEEIVLWTSPQFGFAVLSDAWSTGSSIMPQKRNPDAAELVRGKAAQAAARFAALQGIVKALPLAYAKDLQDDKAITFAAFDDAGLCLAAMTGMIGDLTFNRAAMEAAAGKGYSTATDLADWLVRELGLPFRNAHHVTGEIVKRAEDLRLPLQDVPLAEMQKVEPRIHAGVFDVLSVSASASSRKSYGGTAPENVRAQVAAWKERLK